MTFAQAVRSAFSGYATFSGRARRSEYWWFYLFTVLVGIGTSVVDSILDLAFDNELGVVNMLASLALLLPSLAVTVRRLHDTGRTGWWMLLPVVPVIVMICVVIGGVLVTLSAAYDGSGSGGIPSSAIVALLVASGLVTLAAFVTVLVFLCLDSEPRPNKYGPSPKHFFPPAGPYGYYPWPAPGYGQPPYGYPGPLPGPPSPGSPPQR